MSQNDTGDGEFETRLRGKGYRPLSPFFVLREGELTDERSGGVVRLTRDRLEKIAAAQNSRIQETGDATPIVIGHTRRSLSEKDQPELVGWATKFRVVKFFRTDSWGLEATPWATEEDAAKFAKYPRRSAELWTNPDLIDPISLLGANTPRLDLGPHQLHRPDGGHVYQPRTSIRLEMDMADESTPDTSKPAGSDPANSPANAGQSSDATSMDARLSKIESMLAILQPLLDEISKGGMGDPAGGMGGPPGGGMGGPPPMPGGGMGGPPPMPPAPGGPPQPVQAAAYPAGGTNPMVPQQFGHQGQPIQFGYGQGQALTQEQQVIVQQQQQLEAMSRQVAAIQLQKAEDDALTLLREVGQKVVVDPNKNGRDFQRLVRLSRADQEAEVAYWQNTRRAVETQTPQPGVPLAGQLQIPQAGAAPMQLGRDTAFSMPGDPMIFNGAPKSEYEAILETVRNRGNLSPMEAYEKAMAASRPGGVAAKPL